MAFNRPDITTLIERTDADLESRLSKQQLRRSNAKVYARTISGVAHGLYGYIQYLSRQLFVDTAETEYLDRHASVCKISRKQASKATGQVTFAFADEPVEIPIGTVIQSETNIQYQTTSAVTEEGIASVEALTAGSDGNLDDGEMMSTVSALVGVMSEVTCNGISGGSNAETDEALRSRVLAFKQNRPQGGSASDYISWALEVPGVTRAWCYPLENGLGTVVVRFVCDELADIIPTVEMVETVQKYINTVRPVTAAVTVAAPYTMPVDITISGLFPDDETVRASIESELKDLFTREGEPGTRLYVSHIRAAISLAAGETDHTLVSPLTDVVPQVGYLPVLGNVIWQS